MNLRCCLPFKNSLKKHYSRLVYFMALKLKRNPLWVIFGLLAFTVIGSNVAHADRIKDLVGIEGVRENQVIGYGLVVGLEGTGDQSVPFTELSIHNTLLNMGVHLPFGTNHKAKNTAAVMVTGSIGAFAQIGQTFDVTVSSMGSAKSLRRGTLIMTPLKGADGQIYAMAQGNLTVGDGLNAGTGPQASFVKPIMIINGATVERVVSSPLGSGSFVYLENKENDFSTTGRIANVLNQRFGFGTAQAQNGRVIKVRAPMDHNQRVEFITRIEELDVPYEPAIPKVVLNVRTGSVVMNKAVTLDACAVSHGDISIVVSETPLGTQTMPLSVGKLMTLKPGVLLSDVVNSLNKIGASPQDLLVILQAMKAAGALHAEFEAI